MNWQATITKKQYDADIEEAHLAGVAAGYDALYKELAQLIREPRDCRIYFPSNAVNSTVKDSTFVLTRIKKWALAALKEEK